MGTHPIFESDFDCLTARMTRVLIVGQINSAEFQRCVYAAKWAAANGHIELELKELFEFEWTLWLTGNRAHYGIWARDIQHMVAINDDADDDYQPFYSFCDEKFKYEESEEPDFEAIAERARAEKMLTSKNAYCQLTFEYCEEKMAPIMVELYSTIAPTTCDNFAALCDSRTENKMYKDTCVHRVVPNGWVQMGDVAEGSKGDGGHSSYEHQYFSDETFAVKHARRGMLGMANSGPHTNQSQFYITLEAKPYLDKKYVCFGAVIEGTNTLDALEKIETFNGRPVNRVTLVDCGSYQPPSANSS